jgi:hypothetical protein
MYSRLGTIFHGGHSVDTVHIDFARASDNVVHSKHILSLELLESQETSCIGLLLFSTIVFNVLSWSIASLNGCLFSVAFHRAQI